MSFSSRATFSAPRQLIPISRPSNIPSLLARAQHVVKAERLCKIRKVNVERSADEDKPMPTIAMPAHTPDRPRPQQVGGDSRGESLGCSPAAPNANPKGAA